MRLSDTTALSSSNYNTLVSRKSFEKERKSTLKRAESNIEKQHWCTGVIRGQHSWTALHIKSISLENSFCESNTETNELKGHLMLAGRYPFLKKKSQLAQTKIGQAKTCIKKTNKTNISATNIVEAQLIIWAHLAAEETYN